jgi:hypothetical protein
MMNDYQKASSTLGIVLGTQGRAVWLAHRLDGVPLIQVAKEHRLGLGFVKEMLATCDWIINQMEWLPTIMPSRGTYHPCYEGFHQIGDGE